MKPEPLTTEELERVRTKAGRGIAINAYTASRLLATLAERDRENAGLLELNKTLLRDGQKDLRDAMRKLDRDLRSDAAKDTEAIIAWIGSDTVPPEDCETATLVVERFAVLEREVGELRAIVLRARWLVSGGYADADKSRLEKVLRNTALKESGDV